MRTTWKPRLQIWTASLTICVAANTITQPPKAGRNSLPSAWKKFASCAQKLAKPTLPNLRKKKNVESPANDGTVSLPRFPILFAFVGHDSRLELLRLEWTTTSRRDGAPSYGSHGRPVLWTQSYIWLRTCSRPI